MQDLTKIIKPYVELALIKDYEHRNIFVIKIYYKFDI